MYVKLNTTLPLVYNGNISFLSTVFRCCIFKFIFKFSFISPVYSKYKDYLQLPLQGEVTLRELVLSTSPWTYTASLDNNPFIDYPCLEDLTVRSRSSFWTWQASKETNFNGFSYDAVLGQDWKLLHSKWESYWFSG